MAVVGSGPAGQVTQKCTWSEPDNSFEGLRFFVEVNFLESQLIEKVVKIYIKDSPSSEVGSGLVGHRGCVLLIWCVPELLRARNGGLGLNLRAAFSGQVKVCTLK